MKLKEVPPSIFRAWKLRRTSPHRFGHDAPPCDFDVHVSLTSIRARLSGVDLTIRSLLDQTVRAPHITLWLHESLRTEIPKRLRALLDDRFSIGYTTGTSPHRKLVEALARAPSSVIVTCDDDMMYPADWLARLVSEHELHPTDIVAHECRRITRDEHGELKAYRQWRSETPGESHPDSVAIGYGGVLYPADALDPQVLDERSYLQLAPWTDDLWFKSMSLLAGVATRRSRFPRPKPQPIVGAQCRVALKKRNVREDENRIRWDRLSRHFGLRV